MRFRRYDRHILIIFGSRPYQRDTAYIYLCNDRTFVGTGCSLSALVAAFCAVSDDRLTASATACALAKKAAEAARRRSEGPGSFHNAYLDGLHLIKPADFTSAE